MPPRISVRHLFRFSQEPEAGEVFYVFVFYRREDKSGVVELGEKPAGGYRFDHLEFQHQGVAHNVESSKWNPTTRIGSLPYRYAKKRS